MITTPITILFVEDDAAVREPIAQLLASQGFRMLVAVGAYEALRLLSENPVDVLFTDIVMPGMNGIELAQKAIELRPDLKIMFVTGYYSRAAEAERIGKLLFKPLRAKEIEAEMRELLAAA